MYYWYLGGYIKYSVASETTITKYAWNYIVATIDLLSNEANLYLNGVTVGSLQLPDHSTLTFSNGTLYIGRNAIYDTAYGISVVHCNGAIDELKIHNQTLAHLDIISKYQAIAPAIPNDPKIFADFEGTNFSNWQVTGEAFGTLPAEGTLENQNEVTGYRGNSLVNSFHGGDASIGNMLSASFNIERDLIKMLVGGGNHPGGTEVRLLIDNKIVRTATGHYSEELTEHIWNVSDLVGKIGQIEIVDNETGGWGHINVDHITFEESQELLDADLFVDANVRHGHDRLRPVYHPMPNTSWANESYALFYYDSKYHMFFQKNPNAPVLHFMHWGHLSSPDLVNWSEERIPFGPDKSPGFDDFGTWSGTSIFNENGEPILFYTGVNTSKATIAYATPVDNALVKWKKSSNNPVIANAPSGLADFRDPFIWEDEGFYYMIVGGGFRNNGGGTLPTYKSSDLVNWDRISDLYQSTDTKVSGKYWEMPAFIKLNDQNEYALVVGPLYTGSAKCIYWIGKWTNEKFEPYHEDPKYFDATKSNLLAPAFGLDEQGRITYIGIIPETRSERDQLAAGWRQTFSIPRVLRQLNDTTLGHYAHPNLCRYRENELVISDRIVSFQSTNNLTEFAGDQTEYFFNISSEIESNFKIIFLQNPETGLGFNFEIRMSEDVVNFNGKQLAYDFDSTRNIEVHAFVDHSILEVFLDNTHVFSRRLYPSAGADKIDIIMEEGSEITLVEAIQWDRMPIGSIAPATVCEPTNIPTDSRQPVEDVVLGIESVLPELNIFPNPTDDELIFEGLQISGNIVILDLSGKSVQEVYLNNEDRISVAHLDSGIYVLVLYYNGKKISKRIIIN